MAPTVASLVEGRAPRIRRIALASLVFAGAFWVLGSALEALFTRHRFGQELLAPALSGASGRLLAAALAVLLYLSRQDRARLHLLSSVVHDTPDGIQIAGLDGTIAYSNPAVQEIYGFSPEHYRGRNVSEMNVDPSFATRVVLPALAKEGRWAGEIEVKHKSGRTFPIWLTASVVHDDRGRPLAAVGIIRDISDRKRTEEALQQYAWQLEQTSGLKELFADILRHDLMGPASALRASIDLLLRVEPEGAPSRKLLTTAKRSSSSLIDMIESAARYAKLTFPQEIDFAPLDLGEFLATVVGDFELARSERNARIVFEPRGRYPARANPMIQDVFANLVSNALKYGPAAGTVAIEVRDLGDRWQVCVADSGEGVPDADKQRIFTRFERLRKEGVKGVGLGLAIAKRIVDLHGGEIWVEDNPGGGSVFCVALAKA